MPALKGSCSHAFVFVYKREFGYYVSFGACGNEGIHYEAIGDNFTYLQSRNMMSLHHAISIIPMAPKMAQGD